jgi:hypothetical protein
MELNEYFKEGLGKLDKYLKDLYSELDIFMRQFDKNAKGYDKLAKADKKYRSVIDGLKSKLEEAVYKSDIGGIAKSSSGLYQILDPKSDRTQMIKNLYANKNIKKRIKLETFTRGSEIIMKYYISPIQKIIEAQKQRKPVKKAA